MAGAGQDGAQHLIVVGAGFGGLSCVQALAGAPLRITLVDRRNYHLFQPLLYQVATAALSPADIAWPIRSILRRQANVEVQLGQAIAVDHAAHQVVLSDGRRLGYDWLVLATGARHAYFGHDEWEELAPGLKRIADATQIRERILTRLEQAELADDPATRRRLLTFVVVGGGPTGVEMAGAIAELTRYALARDFRRVGPADARVVLIEGSDRVLGAFPAELSARTERALAGLGVELLLNHQVTTIDESGVSAAGLHIPAGSVIWAAGVQASPVARWLEVPADRAGRVAVDQNLEVPGRPGVFVIGDAAAVPWTAGGLVPGIAPAAKQMGRHVARRLRFLLGEAAEPPPFHYRHAGNLATIGRRAAVVDFGRIRLSGYFAWLVWGVAHIYFLISWRNRLMVAINWLWDYVTFQRGARLIVGATAVPPSGAAAPVPGVDSDPPPV
ncbi:MAG TPA: NAD(P)/FAD-dependent oxidoreductase [Geminicoccus sp.]|uniref:NAD(P)/FAD-dependent oxidoreductase n=1 Tax=Geminicoccus sp. TaxID=2024832 RepID=UPI002BE57FD6|nr:NAD(P)/FAD-dependent oxidoreductase [Geminicoccus sp.]HWL67572.1 NAD(P)/FAD-dependent oxidoreductase [Geminicoccus sp.]